MKRTNILRLQMPEPGDEYSSNTLTQNTNTLNRIMANVGGRVPRKEFNFPADTSAVLTPTSNVNITGGSFVVYGDGVAFIEVNFNSKIDLGLDSLGRLSSVLTVADINPEFDIAVNSPMTSGAGPAIQGYYAANPPRLRLQALKGYSADNKIAAGTTLQLTGHFPLKNVPKNIGLEQMNPARFDYEVHTRNLMKIDEVAEKLKMLEKARDISPNVAPVAGVTVSNQTFHLNSNGWVTLSISFRRNTSWAGNSSGDAANTIIGYVPEGYRPTRYVKLVSGAAGVLIVGEINPSTGAVSITANLGKNYTVPAGQTMQLMGDWPIFDGS